MAKGFVSSATGDSRVEGGSSSAVGLGMLWLFSARSTGSALIEPLPSRHLVSSSY